MPDTTPEWHLSLTEGVRALGAAARELQAAHQHARHTAWSTDPARIVPVPGLVNTPGAEAVRPHEEALWQLGDLYMVLEHHTLELYENAALGYAYGTAHALTAVLRSKRPSHIQLSLTRNGLYVPPDNGLPDLSASLSTRAGGPELAELRARFLDCEQSRAAETTETADDETEFAVDLADSAYAYGKAAEHALHHLIHLAGTNGFLHAS